MSSEFWRKELCCIIVDVQILTAATNYWKHIIRQGGVIDIYSGEELTPHGVSIDHFANQLEELWYTEDALERKDFRWLNVILTKKRENDSFRAADTQNRSIGIFLEDY